MENSEWQRSPVSTFTHFVSLVVLLVGLGSMQAVQNYKVNANADRIAQNELRLINLTDKTSVQETKITVIETRLSVMDHKLSNIDSKIDALLQGQIDMKKKL